MREYDLSATLAVLTAIAQESPEEAEMQAKCGTLVLKLAPRRGAFQQAIAPFYYLGAVTELRS